MAGRQKKLESTASSSALPYPPWIELPWDITANILGRLSVEEKLVTAQVCPAWRSVCKDPDFWRKIHISRDPVRRIDYEMMCRHAVDWSQGQLLELSISGFGSEGLLDHIAERSNGLRALSIDACDDITENGVVDATKGLLLLEELRFSSTSEFPSFALLLYPLPALKSLTIKWTMGGRWGARLDNEATCLEEIMKGVYKFRMVGKVVLLCHNHKVPLYNAQSHLRSLNLELGFNLSINGDMANQVSQKIKSIGCFYDDGFRGEYNMHYHDSTRVCICLVYVV